MRDANNSPNREQDQGPYTVAQVRYLQTCLRRQTRRVIIVTIKCQERANTRKRSNTCSHLKDQSSTGTSTTCPSKADLNKLIDEKLRAKERWSFNTDTGRHLSCESCVTHNPVQCPSSKRAARRKRNTHRIFAGSKRGRGVTW